MGTHSTGDTDRALLEQTLAETNERLVQVAHSLGQYPHHVELQRSFVKLVGQRDELEQRLTTLLSVSAVDLADVL